MDEGFAIPSRGDSERAYRIALTTPVWSEVSHRFLFDWSCLVADISGPKGEWAEWGFQIASGSLLPLARNNIVLGLKRVRNDYTHLIMVDSDVVGLTHDHIKRMVEHDVPIVSALVCLREKDCRPACEKDDEYKDVYAELEQSDPGIVPRKWVGTGCICIKWGVLEDMAIECERPDGGQAVQWFRTRNCERVSWKRDWQEAVDKGVRDLVDVIADGGKDQDDVLGKMADVINEAWMQGRDIWNGGHQMGEDVEFGLRARSKGYESFIDCGIQLGHLGERKVGLQDHLDFIGKKGQAGPEGDAAAYKKGYDDGHADGCMDG